MKPLHHKRHYVQINSSSMADIAFLLLIFFLVTTTIQSDKGLSATLPPYAEKPPAAHINERNLFKIQVNSRNMVLVEGEPFRNYSDLHSSIKKFILNYDTDPHLSVNPEKAVVSLQMNRGTKYKKFIDMMDAVQGVYYEIYGERVGISATDFRNLELKNVHQHALYQQGREGIPMNISIAEPYKIK